MNPQDTLPMQLSTTNYFVQVNEPQGSEYHVGPFGDSRTGFDHARTAITWIYQQIGLLKTAQPSAELIKHRWHFQEKSNGFETDVEIAVEIAGYRLEIKKLADPSTANVISHHIERRSDPD